MPDPLSEMLALVDARCSITGGFRAGGDWAIRFTPDTPVKFDAVTRGSCWLVVDGRPATHLTPGDVVVFNALDTAVLCSAPGVRAVTAPELDHAVDDGFALVGSGDDVEVIGGHVSLDPAAADLFTSALPSVTHAGASSAEAPEMRRLLERIVEETRSARPGAGFATDQLAQLLLLQVLRVGLQQDALTHPGWLRLHASVQLRPAVALMHADPARAWALTELAAAAGMSRSHFAHRFREISGQPPLTYLSHWRIRLAQRALRTSDATTSALAGRFGYASESSFSHAFTRVTGTSPSGYRRDARAL
jgi:AraC-like DNA-binding protein